MPVYRRREEYNNYILHAANSINELAFQHYICKSQWKHVICNKILGTKLDARIASRLLKADSCKKHQ